jgi:hypothetical protein
MRLLLFILGISVCVASTEKPPRPKTILGAHITVTAGTAAARIAVSQPFNNVWTP